MTSTRAFVLLVLLMGPLLALPVTAQQGPNTELRLSEPVEVTALAVALTEQGETVGTSATISVSVATGGSGHVFIDTRPLAGTDIQGSARIAARVASAVTGYAMEQHDFFFVVRSRSPIIAGPSAGGIMTAAAVTALENVHLEPGDPPWEISPDVMATGTISPDGAIGPVGGILEKAQAAAQAGAGLFLVPEGQGILTPRQVVNGAIQEGEPVNVTRHCQEEVGITCREVGTIEHLVEAMTGHTFLRSPVAGTVTTAQYNETLAPLSQTLIEQARGFQDTWVEVNASSIDQGAKDQVLASIDQARAFYGQANQHWASAEYYSAASRAFSAAIHSGHAASLLAFFRAGRSLDFIEDRIAEASEDVAEAEEAAGDAEVTGMHTLYTVGAAQERVSDGEAHIRSARQALAANQLGQALFDASWATERAETVHWWLSLSEAFGAGPELPQDIEELADEFIGFAEEMTAYAGSVLQVSEGPPRARELLSRAKADHERGFHAAAVVEAAQAQVRATLAVELAGGPVSQDKVNTSAEEAARGIDRARERGVEPVLAVAMYEFAGAQSDRPVALEFYRTARTYAGFSSILTSVTEPTDSRFSGFPEVPATGGHALPADVYRQVAVGWLAIGVFSTLALVVLGAAIWKME